MFAYTSYTHKRMCLLTSLRYSTASQVRAALSFTMDRYGSLYEYTIYLALLTTMRVPLSTSFQPPLWEQCLVHTVHKSWEKSDCEARNLYPFTEWQVLWLASFSGLPHLQVLITCSMQEKEGEGPSHGKKPQAFFLHYCILWVIKNWKH